MVVVLELKMEMCFVQLRALKVIVGTVHRRGSVRATYTVRSRGKKPISYPATISGWWPGIFICANLHNKV